MADDIAYGCAKGNIRATEMIGYIYICRSVWSMCANNCMTKKTYKRVDEYLYSYPMV